jgi:hypothetical protein
VGGYTEWIKCERGVKQGCILSPMPFVLYIAQLGNILQNRGDGVPVGDVRIPALFFADDLVIVARTEEELMRQIAQVQRFAEDKRLEINFKKTEIMKSGPGTAQEKTWMVMESGIAKAMIEETNVYKYLGIRLSRHRLYQQHIKHLKTGIPRRIGLMKHQASGVPDSSWAGYILWRQSIRPALLYGAEVVSYTKEITRQLEVAQNAAGRWIIGGSRRIATCGLRSELGWNKMEDEIQKRKVIYWCTLMQMDESRWAKQALKMILRGSYSSNWYRDVQEAIQFIGSIWDLLVNDKWKEKLKVRWRRAEEREWQQEKSTKKSLQAYPKETMRGKEEYINSSIESKMMCRYRLGDIEQGSTRCMKCLEDTGYMVQHKLRGSKLIERERVKTGNGMSYIHLEQECCATNMATIIILGDTRKVNQKIILNLHRDWEEIKMENQENANN